MDTESARIVAIREDNGRTWRFNVCTNTWRRGSQVHLPYTWPTPTAMNLRAVYVPTSDRVFAFADGAFAAYSVERDRWTSFGKANKVVAKQGRPYLAYDAAARRILVFTANRGAVWSYRPGSKRWQRLSGGAAGLGPRFLSDGPLTTFDPTRRQLIVYMYGQRRTWTFDVRQRTWSRRKGGAVGLGGVGWAPSGGEMAFDVEADRALAFSDGGVSAYSPDTRTRREVVIPFGPLLHPPRSSLTGPLARVHSTLVYDPVNSRVVVMGGEIRTKDQDGMWKQATDVMAYRYSTDTWSRLVRPR